MQLIRWADYFYLLRPVLFFPAWTTLMAGYLAAHGRKQIKIWEPIWWNEEIFWACVSSALVLGAGFIVNQLQDTETDRINSKNFFLSNGLITHRHAKIQSSFLLIAGLSIAALYSADWLMIYLAGIVFFLIGYNYPPFIWKDKAWSGLLTNAAMGGVAFAFGWISVPLALFDFFEDAAPYLFYNTALFLLTTIPDMEGDRQTGKNTFPVVYGMGRTIVFSFTLYGLALITAWTGGDQNIGIPALILLPFYLILLIRRNRTWSIRTLKFGLFFFALMIGVYFPLYLIGMILFFFVTRAYYQKRFNLLYPSFNAS